MRLPESARTVVEWAYPGGAVVPCLRRVGWDRMLCGRFLNPPRRKSGWVPVIQLEDPVEVCPDCVTALDGLFGLCPVCDVPVLCEGGRVGPHDGCVGVNMQPRSR